jgi:RNA polymerase sigma-B factor
MELHDKLRQVRAAWSARYGQEPTTEELRRALELSPQQWLDLLRGQALARPLTVATALQDLEDLTPETSDTTLEDGPFINDVMLLLGRLDPSLRQVIQHVVLGGWSYRRTAALMKVSPMTVQRRLKRGLAQLREALNPHPVASVAPAC